MFQKVPPNIQPDNRRHPHCAAAPETGEIIEGLLERSEGDFGADDADAQPERKRQPAPVEIRAYEVKQFCQAYGLCKATVYNLMKAGKLHSVLVGGRRLIPVESAEALLRGGK